MMLFGSQHHRFTVLVMASLLRLWAGNYLEAHRVDNDHPRSGALPFFWHRPRIISSCTYLSLPWTSFGVCFAAEVREKGCFYLLVPHHVHFWEMSSPLTPKSSGRHTAWKAKYGKCSVRYYLYMFGF
ncbi:hypothetical protein PAXRUDRAFT_775137 [Paxillus rubicundulus Ve08.2h10]|uniref:Secreted protein n=1 Tax=Paxillus rubicundulus Ve08.2h10 TaxID=930991 RepID=A0A0D0E478_9AGAM|nr:hypothetical protein PAXRUDRAFT_775137 [Paxillus rubicundulus Ve08.2h10]